MKMILITNVIFDILISKRETKYYHLPYNIIIIHKNLTIRIVNQNKRKGRVVISSFKLNEHCFKSRICLHRKWNVLSKLVVPRLNLSCHYILSELEEIEREDNFRLKRFKELKVKKAKGKEESIITECINEKETCVCTLSFETKEQDEFLYNDQEETEPNTEVNELESNIIEYQFKDTVVDKEPCIICKDFENSLGKTNERDDKIENREITSPIESLLSKQAKDKEQKKTCPNCKNTVKQDEINNYEENNCPVCKNNEMSKVKSKELNEEQILKDHNLCASCKKKNSKEKHVCPSCKNTNTKKDQNIAYKGISTKVSQNSPELSCKTIDKNVCPGCIASNIKQDKNTKSDIDNKKYNMKSKIGNKVCPGCNLDNNDRKYLNKRNEKEITESKSEDYTHDQRGIEEKGGTNYCPACETHAMKNYNTCDCGNTFDIQIAESDENDKALSETCSLCEKMRLSKTIHSSCSCKSNITNKQIDQTCTDNTNETVETVSEIVKFTRLSDTDGIIREEITIKTRRTQKHVLPSSSDIDNNIKKPIEKSKKSIKQTKSENINQCKMNGILKVSSSISSVPTKVSCLSSCSIPISEKHSKSDSGETVHTVSQSVPVSSQNFDSSQCNKTKIKIISKDKNSKENSDEEEIELTPSTIVILKKILSYTSKSAASCCRSIETDQKQTQKSNVGSKAKVSSNINSVKSEPCLQKKIKESFEKKIRKTEPICGTCDSKKDVSKSQEDIAKKDTISPCLSRSNNDLKLGKSKLDPSIKPKQPANIKSHPETDDKICSCNQKSQETTERKRENTKTDTNNYHESDKTKESKDNSSEIKEKEQTSTYVCNKTTTCENKSCQTRQQHHSRELKEKSKSNKSIKTNSKCPHAESCCTCKKKLEVQKTCTCSKTKPISHTDNKTCTCMKAKPKSSKIVLKLSEENCSCSKQTSDLVHVSSSKQSNHSDSCTGSVETLSIANQTCSMDRLSDDASKKSGCLCLKNSNLNDVSRETEKKLLCSKSNIATQKDDSDPCTCKKNTAANGSKVIEKKCSDINKSVSRECSCVSGKDTKKIITGNLCTCHRANNIQKSKDTEIKDEYLCQKHAPTKTSTCSCQQLKSCNSGNKKEKPKCSCESSSKQSTHRNKNKDTVSSGSQTCPKCLSTDQDLKLPNEVCSCAKHKSNHDGHNISKQRECSCTSAKTALSETVNSSKTCNCQAEKTSPSSYKQECCKTSDVKKIHSCTCTKTSELKQPCTCSKDKSDTIKDYSQSSRTGSKTCKDAQSQSKKTNKDHTRECSCRSSKNKIESDSEKSFDSFQSLVKSPCSCSKHNPVKTEKTPPCRCHAEDEKSGSCTKHQAHIPKTETQCSCGPSENSFKPNVSFETKSGKESLTGSKKSQCPCKSKQYKENLKQTCQLCKKAISNPCSCKETKPKMTKTCANEIAASPKCPCESSKQSASIASSRSTESMSVGSQTTSGCASIQTSQKSIRFSYDASPTRTIKSDSTLPTGSSCSLKSCLSSQSQSSLCSCGKKEVSTSTKRSDRYDVRTLRHLPVEPKKLDCPCQSDSAVINMNKPRNFNPVGKCCSLNDSHYFRY